jgi:pimeloyl-ACP methyl ester carboxylesterase
MDSAMSSSYRSLSVAADDGRLHGGELNPSGGTTVVAVHGITANHRTFALLAGALPRHRLLAPDLRGRGVSSTLPGPWGINRHAKDVAGLITASAEGPVVLIGHSMGGFVAAALVRRFPDQRPGAKPSPTPIKIVSIVDEHTCECLGGLRECSAVYLERRPLEPPLRCFRVGLRLRRGRDGSTS